MVVSGKLKKYIGAIEDEEAAGHLYDKYSIILQGLKVSSLNHAFHYIQLHLKQDFISLTKRLKLLCVLSYRQEQTTLTPSSRY